MESIDFLWKYQVINVMYCLESVGVELNTAACTSIISLGLTSIVHILGHSENFLKSDKPRPFTALAGIGRSSSMSVHVAANDGRGYAQP